jgi:hypothetical protein
MVRNYRRHSVAKKAVLPSVGYRVAVVIRETLETCIFGRRQPPVAVADLVPLIVATCGRCESGGRSGGSEDGVTHTPATLLVPEHLNAVDDLTDWSASC